MPSTHLAHPALLRRFLVAAVSLGVFLQLPALAATFNVAPLRIEMGTQTMTAALTLTNPGDQPVVVKVEAVAWAQQAGQDVYTPTPDLLVVPPIFTLPARTSQVVRVALRRPVDPKTELSYRLYLQEVPGAKGANGVNVQVLLRVGLPIFVTPSAAAAPSLSWSAKVGADGTLTLTARNTGNVHVQLTHLRALGADNAAVVDEDLSAYLLPGQTRSLEFKPGQAIAAGSRLRLQAETDAGDLNVELTPDR